MVGVVVAIVWMKDLFSVVMLLGIYGLLTASFFVAMDAVDVAFTEASVGAGISTLLLLVAIAKTKRQEHPVRHKPYLALLVVFVTGALLIYGTFDMPSFGVADAPAHTHVAQRYIQDSYEEIGIPNIVTSVLASYRGFDTFGEVVVIFTAGIAVIALLSVVGGVSGVRRRSFYEQHSMYEQHKVLRIVSKILIPFILIFALYVQFHGEYSPGGGFQAGVIFAAGLILFTMLFGLSTAQRFIQPAWLQLIAALGVLIYGAVGVVSFLNGGSFLNYSVLLDNPVAGQHVGIILIELGVGLTVASVITLIFFNFANRKEQYQIIEPTGE